MCEREREREGRRERECVCVCVCVCVHACVDKSLRACTTKMFLGGLAFHN